MKRLYILTIISTLVTAGILFYNHDKTLRTNSSASETETFTPKVHRRTADQTFLTYPEWFLVYSPEEFAVFTKENPAHRFPFFGHVRQFWGAYASVNRYIFSRYPFNFGYHVMVLVIGGSTTLEYALRSCYENVIGRLSFATTGNKFTDEDRFAAVVAREYVDFIKVQPWYEFDFNSKLRQLWRNNPATGKNMIRKWERRYILTSDYAVKAVYAWIIKKATKASYQAPILSTAVVLDKAILVEALDKSCHIIAGENNQDVILLPRYDAFKDQALLLSLAGFNFREIAGNKDVVMITLLVPSDKQVSFETTRLLFVQTILTNKSIKRIALIVPVASLGALLRQAKTDNILLEHIYDF